MSMTSTNGLRPFVRKHDNKSSTNKWIMEFQAHHATAQKVICLPHAGCGAAAFKTLTGDFFHNRDMVVVQYPGRETRMRDPFVRDMHDLVDDIVQALIPHMTDPYILFGHSMGSKVAYEVIQRLQVQKERMPDKMVVSCSPAPHRPSGLNNAFQESDDLFLRYLKRLGGVPDELLAIPDLLNMVLPILRADFELLYRYQAPANAEKIKCALSAIGSAQDVSVKVQDVAHWQDLCAEKFDLIPVEGGHFYFSNLNVGMDDLIP
ncbi:thioesterase II family protein [Terasakiella sp.]|uniref:thioesterase II family protein n=1 Tax=Terasakiella sp. TaxID=2034861 RepID=UPI003AA9CABC